MESEKTFWVKFFEDAGLPPKIASKYKDLFLEHRIQRSMLVDVTKKPILNEIGITAIGDVLAISKQAKIVANKDEVEAKETMQKVAVIPNEQAPIRDKSVVAMTSRTTAPPPKIVSTTISTKRARLQTPPDNDVSLKVNMPQGTTERSRKLLTKAAAIGGKTAPVSKKKSSVFDRLGGVAKNARVDAAEDEEDEDEERDQDHGWRNVWPCSAISVQLRKNVSFATGTKESSPEVTSTTDEYFGKLESDKLARKVSALQRLGMKPTNEVVKVVAGERRLLVAKRPPPKPKSIFERLG